MVDDFRGFSSEGHWTRDPGVAVEGLGRPLGRGSLFRSGPSAGTQRWGPVWRRFWEGERERQGLPPLSLEEQEEEEEEEREEEEWRRAREAERWERERERK